MEMMKRAICRTTQTTYLKSKGNCLGLGKVLVKCWTCNRVEKETAVGACNSCNQNLSGYFIISKYVACSMHFQCFQLNLLPPVFVESEILPEGCKEVRIVVVEGFSCMSRVSYSYWLATNFCCCLIIVFVFCSFLPSPGDYVVKNSRQM